VNAGYDECSRNLFSFAIVQALFERPAVRSDGDAIEWPGSGMTLW